jgi:hypothetical protein
MKDKLEILKYLSGDIVTREGVYDVVECINELYGGSEEDPARLNESDFNLLCHCACYLGYRKLEGVHASYIDSILHTSMYDDMMLAIQQALNIKESANAFRWKISFHAMLTYTVIKDNEFTEYIGPIERFQSKILGLVKSYPSCFVSVCRVSTILAYHYYLTEDYDKVAEIARETHHSFNECMYVYTFGENVSKAAEVLHIAEALLGLQYIMARSGVLIDNSHGDRPPHLPVHYKHLPYSNSLRKLGAFNNDKAIWKYIWK